MKLDRQRLAKIRARLSGVLDHQIPPGLEWRTELKWTGMGLVLSAVISGIAFLVRMEKAYEQLFYWEMSGNGVRIKLLKEGAVINEFADILDRSLIGFVIIALAMVALAGYHYAYHYQGSKSIYLMRRLPRRFELHRRCLLLPALLAVISLCVALGLVLIYFAIYLAVTPEGCLPSDQWQRLWQVWLGFHG